MRILRGKKMEWISIKEKLPNDTKLKIVILEFYKLPGKTVWKRAVDIAMYSKNKKLWFSPSNHNFKPYKRGTVIYWMSIPQMDGVDNI